LGNGRKTGPGGRGEEEGPSLPERNRELGRAYTDTGTNRRKKKEVVEEISVWGEGRERALMVGSRSAGRTAKADSEDGRKLKREFNSSRGAPWGARP